MSATAGSRSLTASYVLGSKLEQFPTDLRGRGHLFGEATGRMFSGVITPFILEPYTGSATFFFGWIAVLVAIGACIPLAFGKETVGQLELVTEAMNRPLPNPRFSVRSLVCPGLSGRGWGA